jgi:hypothetical protein
MHWTLRRVAARFQRTVNGLALPFANDRNAALEQWLRRAAG